MIERGKMNSRERSPLLSGSAWMTAGSILSRALGAVYVIPWLIWLQPNDLLANSLYTKGYQIYSIFLIISTAGVPGAISKQLAHYNALGEYENSHSLLHIGLILMFVMGLVSFIAMYFFANIFAAGDSRMIPIFRSLSYTLLIIPVMSLMRGYFQGFSQMAPSAISQFIEQIARVAYMLGATYLIMRIQHGSILSAVKQSTFAAFIGAVFGLLVLIIYYVKQKINFVESNNRSSEVHLTSSRTICYDIFRQSIPFIFLDSGINLFYIIDQYTFFPIMKHIPNITLDVVNGYYAIFSGNANKLIMIVVSLATSISVTAIPLLSGAFSIDNKKVEAYLANIFKLFSFVMFPSALGLAAISKPLYNLFFGSSIDGFLMLQFSAFLAILFGLFILLSSVLQGMYQSKAAITGLIVGIISKLIIQYPVIKLFKAFGPLIATFIAIGVSCAFMLYCIFELNLNWEITLYEDIETIIFSSILMYLPVFVLCSISIFHFGTNRIVSLFICVVAVLLGCIVYVGVLLKSKVLDDVLGRNFDNVRARLLMILNVSRITK